MGAILKAGDLRIAEFVELVASLAAEEDPLVLWAEGVDGWALEDWKGPDAPVRWNAAGGISTSRSGRSVLERSVSGRLFAPSGELKWRLVSAPDGFRSVFLGERDWIPGLLTPRDELTRLGLSVRREILFLWGERSEHSQGDWVELRIPHRFRYPARGPSSDPKRPVGMKVKAEVWADRWGEPHFTRLCELVNHPIAG